MSTAPDQPFADDAATKARDSALQAAALPPAVWPVFAMFVAAIVGISAVQIPIALVVIAIKPGGKTGDVLEFIQTPGGFITFAVASEATLLVLWWAATTLGDPRTRAHRAIGPTSLSTLSYVCITLATPVTFWLGEPLSRIGVWLLGEWTSDRMFEGLYDHMTWPTGIAFVLFIGLVPGFVEELFFRGYVQRRLLDRWSPAVVVPLVAVLFAASHSTPAWALGVLPISFWLGLLAWRTGSLRPGIICHAFINSSVNLWRVGAALGSWPAEPSTPVLYGAVAFCSLCMALSLWVLFKYQAEGSLPLDA
jgi:membrane protease YdiL (CAAX protease family)